MPESNQWTVEQTERIERFLESKWPKFKECDHCHEEMRFIARSPGHVLVGGPDGSIRLGETFPCIILMCSNCGHTQLINALVAGVTFSEPEKESSNG